MQDGAQEVGARVCWGETLAGRVADRDYSDTREGILQWRFEQALAARAEMGRRKLCLIYVALGLWEMARDKLRE